MSIVTEKVTPNMQRIKLLSSPYSFSSTWVGAILFATHSKSGGGWDIHFPYPVGTVKDADEGAKKVWFHCGNRVKLLPDIQRADKPRYTLVPSLINKGEQVWAKLESIQRKNALDCPNCAFDRHTDECHASPPCSSHTRHDGQDVIFITEVNKWGQ